MFDTLYALLDYLFGLSVTHKVAFFHMAMRSVFVYILGILIIKTQRRFMQLRTVFNFFLYVLLGSMLAGGIMDVAPFFDSIAAVIFIMLINALITISVFYFPHWGVLLKGSPAILIKDGQIQWSIMKKYFITQDELFEALHEAHIDNLDKVKEAIFEDNGSITIIKK